jgi:thiol-disulfide isomerase/thioredoxin
MADFKGKVVLVETLAMWCSNCMKQQRQVIELHKLLGEREDFVSVGLDIDVNESLADLKTYVENNGFDWKYAVATPEIAREIGELYGQQFLNPPSTPMLILDRKGEVHPLPFGIKSAEDLMKALEPFLSADM